LSKKHSKQ